MKLKLTIVLLLIMSYSNAQTTARYSVVISEIMADPSPTVGLPNIEYIELKNTSATPINLNGWRVADASTNAIITVNFILQPDSQVIICSNASAPAMSAWGSTLGVSNFPSLNNEGEWISLRSKEGAVIHAVEYSDHWYQNAVKSEGGWSLEMIDSNTPCSATDNWRASTDASGGTPGRKNAVAGVYSDKLAPSLLYVVATDSVTLVAVFDESLDSTIASATYNYSVTGGVGAPVQATPLAPLFKTVQLRFSNAINSNTVYQLTVTNTSDCAGNIIGALNKAPAGRPSGADPADIVFNEVLFDPLPDGAAYVELYNRSKKIIDLKECYITNRLSNGGIGTLRPVSTTSRLIFPGDYIVITEDPWLVKRHYLAKNPDAFVTLSTMPSLPNDKGTLVLLDAVGKVIDELAYFDHWHFKLLSNTRGVALERIDFNKPTANAGNWHSAATNIGYGTPTYQNSQFAETASLKGSVTISPPVFSPDNDGRDDVLTLQYAFTEQGYVCNTVVFDANGRVVKNFLRNVVCGLTGYFRWDGLGEKNQSLPVGTYIIYTEVFNLAGKTMKFKQAVTLARKY